MIVGLKERFAGENGHVGVIQQADGTVHYSVPPIHEVPQGPYTSVHEFSPPSWMLNTEIDPIKRYTAPRSAEGSILELEDATIAEHLQLLTDLANNPEHNFDNPQDRLTYQQSVMKILEKGAVELIKAYDDHQNISGLESPLKSKNLVVLPPLQGGMFTAAAFIENMGKLGYDIPMDAIACFELKRAKFVGNGFQQPKFYIGYREGYIPPLDENTALIVADDCVAMQVSAETSIKIARQKLKEYYGHEARLKAVRPIVLVTVASQIGMSELHRSQGAITITGGIVHALDGDGYLRRTNAEGGGYYVGDMGKWLRELPVEFDPVAPWNVVRRELMNYWKTTNRYPALT